MYVKIYRIPPKINLKIWFYDNENNKEYLYECTSLTGKEYFGENPKLTKIKVGFTTIRRLYPNNFCNTQR